jgi:NAD(P)-dependent dehydrogenase (short-subunit alcohol dehydrogenase family)
MAFEGRVALITGAASGMGRLAALRLAAAGRRVAALDRDAEGLAALGREHDAIATWCVDVADAGAVREAVEKAEAELGPLERVYAAAAIQPTAHLLDQDLDEIHRVMRINYGGLVNVTKATLPRMLERGRGDLILFGSIAGWVPNMHFGAYSASKFAVIAFAEVLYHETRGRGVRVLCVCPAQVDTPLRAQATSKPKIMQVGPAPMPPGVVLDAIERGLARGALFVFPGWQTRMGFWLRRFAPWLLWRVDHRAEGY